MMAPSAAEERGLALRRPVGWRRMPLVTQVVLFVLTALAITALFWFISLFDLPKGWITAIVCIAAGEVLIRRARFWRTGVESALWIGGLLAFIFGLPSSGKPEAILVFALAAAIAGWRVRNALFETLAVVLITAYLDARHWPWPALAFALTVTVVALIAEMRIWQRPSTEFLWKALLVVMPVAGYFGVTPRSTPERVVVQPGTGDIRVIVIFAVLAVIFAVAGMRFRLRVMMLASAVTVAVAGYEARPRIPLSDEAVLIVSGAIVLLLAAALMRALRGRERGFVLTHEPHEIDELLQIAATLPLAAPAAAPAQASPTGGGGQFGGAGASGQF